MSSQLESIYSDELFLLAETLGEVKTRTEKLEGEFSTHAKPLEAATNALSAALSGIKALQFHVLDNNLGALSARVEEMRKAVDEQVGVIALELKKADETNAAKAGADAEALRSEIVALQSQLGSLVTQFGQQLERVEFAAKEEAKKLQLIPGPAGAAGASLNPRGTFIDGETYNRLDVVSWLGSSYIATVDGVKEKPSKNSNQWQTLASRGGGGAGGVGDFGSLAGVAQINQGGTGQTTRAAGLNALLPSQTGNVQYMLLTDGAGNVSWGAQPVAGLPSQTSNGGKLLTTDGTNASWSNAVTVSGSNATVTGTLTVNGAGNSVFAGKIRWGNTTYPGYNAYLSEGSSDSQLYPAIARNLVGSTGTSYTIANGELGAYCGFEFRTGDIRWFGATGSFTTGQTVTPVESMRLVSTGNLLIGTTTDNGQKLQVNGAATVLGTTASTSTSSGALVVGNGTSGGLGVGGDANIGGVLRCTTGTIVASGGTPPSTGYGVELQSNGTNGYVYSYNRNTTSAMPLYLNHTGGNLFLGNITSVANIVGTTASTGTSSGALVVSGGVGVAGAIYGGGNLLVSGTGKIGAVTAADSRFHVYESSAVDVGNGVTIEQAGTGDAVTAFLLTGVQRWSVGIDNSDSDKFKIGTGALGSADRLTIDTSGNTTIAGTLQVGNAYVAGAPTATGYIVIKDSTGTSYKIPAVAL